MINPEPWLRDWQWLCERTVTVKSDRQKGKKYYDLIFLITI